MRCRPGIRASRRAIALLLATAFLAIFAAGARADSLVYVKEGEVWISHGDGSDARQVTAAPDNWSWPSEDDSGVIVVAGGAGGIGAEEEDTPGSEVYRLDQHGATLSAPQQTPGSASTPGCVTYAPEGLRVAPDGRHYVYDAFVCDRFDSLIGTVGGEGFSGSEYLSEFRFPFWVDDSDFVASRDAVPFEDSEGEWWVHPLGEAANRGYNWFGDPETYVGPDNPDGWATGFDAIAVSRDGTKVATLEEDAGNWIDGAARRVAIRLWSAGGAPTPAHPSVSTPVFRCEIPLPPDPGTTAWFDNAGPSFSPDGTRLAFAEPDGVHVAAVSNLDDCATVTAPLVIPGATQPFWSAADEAADAGHVQPSGGGGGGAGGGAGGGGPARPGGGPSPTAPADRSAPVLSRLRMGRGGLSLAVSEPGTLEVKLSRCVAKRVHHRRVTVCKAVRTIKVRVTRPGQVHVALPAGLRPGRYEVTVRARDSAGNVSPATSRRFVAKGKRHGRRHRGRPDRISG